MTDRSGAANTAAELRTEFDRTYAIPPSSQGLEPIEGLLAVRVAGDPYALRISEISGLANDRKIVALPSPISELLGVAGIRGGLVSVYSLAALLGYNFDGETPRWLALCGTEEHVGFAFHEFEGYLRVPRSQIYSAPQADAERIHVKEVARTGELVRAVVSIPAALETIKGQIGKGRSSKER